MQLLLGLCFSLPKIRSNIVSCATICYDLLKAENYDVNRDIAVATALYYGLFMDSNELSEVRHPLERDMLDFLKIDEQLLNHVTHANFTLEEFETAGMAMLRYNYNENKRLAIIKAKPCDPNILGLVGDFVLQVDSIDVCISKIRTYEGDVAVKASEDIYVMIGLLGEVYPIEREKFEQKYQALEEPYFKEYEYAPSVVEVAKMKKYELLPYAKQCVRKADSSIYAKKLTISAKVFSKWNYENYMYGKVGDYICYSPDDETDVYIVKKEIFEETYVCEE